MEIPVTITNQNNKEDDDDDDDDAMFGDDIALDELDISAIINANKKPELTMSSDMFDDLDMDELNDLIKAEETIPSQPPTTHSSSSPAIVNS